MRLSIILSALLSLMFVAVASGQSWYSDDTSWSDESAFGSSVAIAGEDVMISEPQGFRYPGTIHVFRRSSRDGWQEVQSLQLPDGTVGDQFASVIAAEGDLLLARDSQANDGRGAVHVFRRTSDGTWTPGSVINPDTETKDAFGAAMAVAGQFVLIGAPATDENRGAVYVYRRGDDGLTPEGMLPVENLATGGMFGAAIAAEGNMAVVGAPLSNLRSGAAYVFYRNTYGEWTLATRAERDPDADLGMQFGRVVATNGRIAVAGSPMARETQGLVAVVSTEGGKTSIAELPRPALEAKPWFGSAIALTTTEMFVAAQQNNSGSGSVIRYELVDGRWMPGNDLFDGNTDARLRTGSALAVSENVLVVASTGDAYGEGSVYFLDKATNGWSSPSKSIADIAPMPRVAGEQVDCSDGDAAGYSCSDVDLVSFIPNVEMGINRGVRLNDVWGWTDPASGKEYAIIGHMEGVEFLDISDPNNPVHLGTLDRTEGSRANTWRDIKTYKNHAYIVADGAGNHGMQVFDLTQLRGLSGPPVKFTETTHYAGIHSSHNIVINEDTGFAYAVGSGSGGETCGGGLHMIDIREPANPTFIGCFADENTGRASTGYSHDSQCVVYSGPDATYRGREICFSANETAISIADVTDKANPKAISSGTYPDFAYVHQGWLSEDQTYFFQNDEGDETSGKVERTRTLIWDVRDLDDPIMINQYFAEDGATDHNLYVKGNLLYSTNNSAGLRILDVSDPVNPVEVGHFDTTPHGQNNAGFDGTWSSYPYFDSGVIVVTSRREGVFFLKKKQPDS